MRQLRFVEEPMTQQVTQKLLVGTLHLRFHPSKDIACQLCDDKAKYMDAKIDKDPTRIP